MAKVQQDLKYTENHEWAKIEGKTMKVGVTDYAQHAMGDIVYVELPDTGTDFRAGEDLCVIESVKGANDVYSPLSGKVTEVNSELEDSPELINSDPYGSWIAEMELSDPSEGDKLLDGEAYEKLCEKLEAEEGE